MSIKISDTKDLRCCGNCKNYRIERVHSHILRFSYMYILICEIDYKKQPRPFNKCDDWEFDNMSWDERLIK